MIGVFDSGAGGLSVLKELTRLLPEEKYLYYSDNAFCPYGDKPLTFIQERAGHITQYLLGAGADIIVVACNTATAAAIRELRAGYSDRNSPGTAARVSELTGGRLDHVRFIGMEPALKPAALDTKTGVVGVLATAGTLSGYKYVAAKGNVDGRVRVVERVGRGFVELVESGKLTGPQAEDTVAASLEPLLEEGADVIVLGCTHYPFLVGTMEKISRGRARFIDPAPAVARQLVNVMIEEGMLPQGAWRAASGDDIFTDTRAAGHLPKSPDVTLVSSGDSATLHRLYETVYPQ